MVQISEKKLTQLCNFANFRCVNDEVFVKFVWRFKEALITV